MKSVLTALILVFLSTGSARALEVREVKSEGGTVAWLVQDRSAPALSVSLLVRHAGSAYDPEGREGRSALAAKLLTEGAGGRDARAFHETLDFHAIRLGTELSPDDLRISLITLSEHLDVAFSLLHDMLASPRFAPEDVVRLRAEQQAVIRQGEEDAEQQAALGMNAALFPAHPYGRPKNGTFESVEKLEPSDLRDFAAAHLRRGEMILSVAGDITPERLREVMEKYVDPLPEGTADTFLPDVTPRLGQRRDKAMDVPQTVVTFALPGVKRNAPEYYAAVIMNHLLGGNAMSSRLGQEIRRKRGLAYDAGSGLAEYDKAALLVGAFATRGGKAEQAVTALREVVDTLGKDGFTRQEFEEGVSYLTGAFPAKLTSNRSVVAYLESMQLHELGRDYLDKRNTYLEAVSFESVNLLAKKLLNSENLLIMTVGKSAN